MKPPGYRRRPHTADVRLVVWGSSFAELCRNAVRGTLHEALGAAPRGAPRWFVPVESLPEEPALRLVGAVNEALFQLFSRRLLTVDVRLDGPLLSLGVRELPQERHPQVEVKAATLHHLPVLTMGGRQRLVLTLDL